MVYYILHFKNDLQFRPNSDRIYRIAGIGKHLPSLMQLKPNEQVTQVKDRIAKGITTKQVSGCGVKPLNGLYTSWAQDACASPRLAGLSLLSTPLLPPPFTNI